MNMNDHTSKNSRSAFLRSSVILGSSVASFFALAQSANAQVTQTAGDSVYGSTSFNTGDRWSDSTAPEAGKTYSTAVLLRTPDSASDFTFEGDSLTLNTGGSLSFKGKTASPSPTITVSLTSDGGHVNSNGGSFTLDGTWNLLQDARFYGYNKLSTIDSLITGGESARLIVSGIGLSGTGSDLTGGTILANSGNSFSGGIFVSDYASLFAAADGALGSGDIRMIQGSSLTLSGGTTNDYIGNGATLNVNANIYAINLDFVGTDNIAALTLDAGSTFGADGTYGAIGSGADFESALFTGTGMLQVIPEPATSGLLIGALALCGVILRRAKR